MRLHHDIESTLQTQQRTLKTVLRTAFSIAGCLWIVAYTLHFSSEDVLRSFKLDQYQIYLVLLTLWGFHAKRDAQRLALILDVAERAEMRASDVDFDVIARHAPKQSDISLFGIFRRVTPDASVVPIFFTWFLLALTLALFGKQIVLLTQ